MNHSTTTLKFESQSVRSYSEKVDYLACQRDGFPGSPISPINQSSRIVIGQMFKSHYSVPLCQITYFVLLFDVFKSQTFVLFPKISLVSIKNKYFQIASQDCQCQYLFAYFVFLKQISKHMLVIASHLPHAAV